MGATPTETTDTVCFGKGCSISATWDAEGLITWTSSVLDTTSGWKPTTSTPIACEVDPVPCEALVDGLQGAEGVGAVAEHDRLGRVPRRARPPRGGGADPRHVHRDPLVGADRDPAEAPREVRLQDLAQQLGRRHRCGGGDGARRGEGLGGGRAGAPRVRQGGRERDAGRRERQAADRGDGDDDEPAQGR